MALNTFEWHTCVIMSPAALLLPLDKCGVAKRHEDYNKVFVYKIRFFEYMPRVPNAYSFDLWSFRTHAEARIGDKLASLIEVVLSWQEIVDVRSDAVLWGRSRLPQDYRETQKATDSFWSTNERMERRARAKFGVFDQWHQPEVEMVRASHQQDRWIMVLR